MGFWVVRRTKRLRTDEEKRSICLPTMAAEVSVAQVARRYALNANMIVDFHAEVSRVFHTEVSHLQVMVCASGRGQGM